MRLDAFDFALPSELIAQRPLDTRDASRMLSLDRQTGAYTDRLFSQLPALLRGDELLVLNNVRVLPARLFGHRAGIHSQQPSRKTAAEHLTGTVEIFLTRQLDTNTWEALVRPGRKIQIGENIIFGSGELQGEILSRGELGQRTVRFHSSDHQSIDTHLERLGHIPLPPYIDRGDEPSDRERYQTVFASKPGAVAAPTAGLHFTPEILQKIKARGCELCEVTLNVGLGTFQPVHTENIEDHKIHSESYEISEQAANAITGAKKQGRPIVAIGTTVVRTLEDAAQRAGNSSEQLVQPGKSDAQIFILPGHKFRIVDALLTNFHLPKSTLLALVSAFAGREQVLNAYRHAVEARYRFYSYGDCMFIR
jgi:S-adenosylmethionine:tRNA ribosyltransferase-isomerase